MLKPRIQIVNTITNRPGFVTALDGSYCWVRYWQTPECMDLTPASKLNSEIAPTSALVIKNTVSPILLRATIERYCEWLL